jgi:hypothetical protein
MPLVLSGTDGISTNGSTWALQFDSSNRVRIPVKPYFLARLSTSVTPGANQPIIFNNIVVNDGNVYNTSNGRFTVPTAGLYQIDFHGLGANNTNTADVRLWVNGSNYFIASYGGSGYTGYKPVDIHLALKLNTNDYVDIRMWSAGEIMYGDSSYHTWFSGYLVG